MDPKLRESIAADFAQDFVSAVLPQGALILDRLQEASGVLHATPQLVLMPDDPRLGEFREDFAGVLGWIEVRADEGPDGEAVRFEAVPRDRDWALTKLDGFKRVVSDRLPDHRLRVTVFQVGPEGEGEDPYYERVFFGEETNEVRVFLHGGDDEARVQGLDESGILITVVGGGGDDLLAVAWRLCSGRVTGPTWT